MTPVRSLLLLLLTTGCVSIGSDLMPTPVVYRAEEGVDPFRGLSQADQDPSLTVFYATDRGAKGTAAARGYTNQATDTVRLGKAAVRIGGERITWPELYAASRATKRSPSLPLWFDHAAELGTLGDPSGERAFADALNAELGRTRARVLNVYVHGYNVDFQNPCRVAAGLSHYMRGEGVWLAFAWPSHQNPLAYGADVRRSFEAAPHLALVLDFLSRRTRATRINVVGNSAGTALVTEGLALLRETYPERDEAGMRRLRIGTVLYSAAVLEWKAFSAALRRFQDLPGRISVLVSPDDAVLRTLGFFGSTRVGASDPAQLTEEQRGALAAAKKVELIDATRTDVPGESGGFGGHFAWLTHSWVSSEVLVSLQYGLAPDARGLVAMKDRRAWYFPEDYPQRVVEIVRAARDER